MTKELVSVGLLLLSVSVVATGRTVLDLKSLASKGSTSGLVRDEFVVSEEGEAKRAVVEGAFEIQIQVGSEQ